MTSLESLLELEKADKRFWLRPIEARELLKCGKTRLWQLSKKGLIEVCKDGRSNRHPKASVYGFLKGSAERFR